MRLIGVRLRNIKTYVDEEIYFPPDGITAIYGDTGSGKTTILSSIAFAIFGNPRGGRKSNPLERYGVPCADDLLRAWESSGEVAVVFLLPDFSGGPAYVVITRRLRREGGRVSDRGGFLKIVQEGRGSIVKRYSAEELTAAVLEVLGIPKQRRGSRSALFLAAVTIPQFATNDIIVNRSFAQLAVSTALNLQRYENIRENVSRVWETLRPELKAVIEKEKTLSKQAPPEDLEELERGLISMQNRMEEILECMNTLSKEKEELEKESRNLEELMNSLNKLIGELTARINILGSYQESINTIREELSGVLEKYGLADPRDIERKVNELRTRREKLDAELKSKEEYLKEIEENISSTKQEISQKQGMLNTLRRELKEITKELENKRRELSAGRCPTCLRRVSESEIEEIMERIRRERNELVKREEVRKLEAEIRVLRQRLQNLDHLREEVSKDAYALKNERDRIQRELDELVSAIGKVDKLNELQKYVSELPELEARLRSLEEQKADTMKRLYKIRESINALQKELSDLSIEHAKLEKDVEMLRKGIENKKELEETRRYRRELEALKELVSGKNALLKRLTDAVEEAVRRKATQILKGMFARYYAYLSEGQEIITVEIGDDLTPKFYAVSPSGVRAEIMQPSGGQVTAASLAYRLALNTVARVLIRNLKESVIMMDEPTYGFSPERVEALKNLLKAIGAPQIIVVTHDRNLMDIADCKIKLDLDATTRTTKVTYEECHYTPSELTKAYSSLLKGIALVQTTTEIQAPSSGFKPVIQPTDIEKRQQGGGARNLLDFINP